jgi:signal transduction histidine kinase
MIPASNRPTPAAAPGHSSAKLTAAVALASQLPRPCCIVQGERLVFGNLAFAQLNHAQAQNSLFERSLADFFSPRCLEVLKLWRDQLAAGQALDGSEGHRRRLPEGIWQQFDISVLLLDEDSGSLLLSLHAAAKRPDLNPPLPPPPADLRGLSERLIQVREDERRRIARELHDELGQQLSALKISISGLNLCPQPEQVTQKTRSALELIDGIVASTRRIAADVRPLMLDDLGLHAAIEWLARQMSERGQLRVRLHLDPCEDLIDEPHATALYRMVQEALTNIERHARATVATVELQHTRHEIHLTVSDNGQGFPLHAIRKPGSHGLLGLRERARTLGGTLELDNLPGGGSSVHVRLPFRRGNKP